MKIERTLDKVVIDENELQQVLLDYIKAKLGRTVSGDFKFSEGRGGRKAAWCHLAEPAERPIGMPAAIAAGEPNFYRDH